MAALMGWFVGTSGSLNANDVVTLRVTSSTNYSVTSGTALLTVAGVDYPFSVTTGGDFVPDAFSFVTQWNVPIGSQVTSNSITITGITGASPISIQGGEYSVGCTTNFTNANGTVSNNQLVCVKANSFDDRQQANYCNTDHWRHKCGI